MNLKEAASLLGWKRELVELAIAEGVETPRTKVKVKLVAEPQGSGFDIPDEELDRFLAIFEKEEPGRNPPVAVRRDLLVECGYPCAICESDAPLRFHHILDWANLKHHDPKHMLAVCGSCHDKIGTGQIDTKSQRNFKTKLADASTRLRRLEESVAKIPPQDTNDWSAAAHEYLIRNVEFAVIHNPTDDPEREYVLPVANGCLVEENRVLTCYEAVEMVQSVAKHKNGTAVILHGHVRYYFEAEEKDETTGLCLCKITGRDEQSYQGLLQRISKSSLEHDIDVKTVEGFWFYPSPTKSVEWSIGPWLGQEVGFILASDSEDSIRQADVSHVEFGTSVISYFKMPKEGGLKVFVTAVFSGRIRQVGSAVFSRNATLLGIISGVEKHEFDAGRRAIVKTLLGFPKYTKPKLKKTH